MNEFAQLKLNVLSPNFKRFGHIDNFFSVVLSTGYPYFQWNGKVYEVIDSSTFPYPIYLDTGKMIEDFE